ncbi:PREDICTED: delta-sarcoglycan-like [Ceratosolen solmsi marchali]|uniref:Delta-sarcoglycan-like n=1 Tax=Ceratosolen solmsi marchali TaxID=326594 RepID=A0AAJ6YJ84_9HYME|nr:PREDICTED: delta-sarcoglycan-like [Ceratosolen solmsi marchali]
MRLSRSQSNWSDEPSNSCSIPRQSGNCQAVEAVSTHTRTRTNALSNECHTPSYNKGLRIGVYGWRQRCLYFLVLGLTIIVILNLALTLWLLKVMEFSFEGIGSLKVIPGGVELKGQATILDALIASSVKSRRGSNLMLESWTNFTASARGNNGQVLARFTLSEDKLECVSKSFRITDPNGELLFSANNEHVVVGAKTLKVTGVGGAVFEGSIQTPLVSSEAARDLRLESATRSLEVRAPHGINVESSAGEISATCLSHMKLTSRDGAVTIESRRVFLKGLRTALLPEHGSSTKSSGKRQGNTNKSEGIAVYQLCACANGRLFLAPAEGICQADKSLC